MYSFLVKGINMGTKILARLYIGVCKVRNLEVDGRPSKENLFGQSPLLMNATYIAFP